MEDRDEEKGAVDGGVEEEERRVPRTKTRANGRGETGAGRWLTHERSLQFSARRSFECL